MEEMHKRRCGKRAWNFCTFLECATLPESLHVNQPRSSLNHIFFWVFMKISLHSHTDKSLAIDVQFNLQCLSSPQKSEVQGDEIENYNPLIMWLVSLATSHHSYVQFKSYLINITRDIIVVFIRENSKDFLSSVPEIGTKNKYLFIIINHNITTANITEIK